MVENDLSIFAAAGRRIHRGAIYGVAARRIAAVGPVHHAASNIEIQVDRFRKTVVKKFDVFSVFGILAFRDFETSSEDATLTGVVGTFLGPVELAAFHV